MTTEITIRCKPFSLFPAGYYRVSVDPSDVVRVYDGIAGHYTVCHGLDERAQAKIRTAAQAHARRIDAE